MPFATNVPISRSDGKPRNRDADFNGICFSVEDGIFCPEDSNDVINQLPYLDNKHRYVREIK